MRSFLRLFTIAAMLLLSFGINAQRSVVYFSEDFETGGLNLPRGWDASDNGCTYTMSNAYIWQTLPGAGYTARPEDVGTCAYLNADPGFTPWATLKTPTIALPSMRDCLLRFRLRTAEVPGNFSVYISTDGGETYMSEQLVTALNPGQDWTLYEFPLSAYAGRSVKIVFYAVPTTTQPTKYYLDAVEVVSAPDCQAVVDPYVTNLQPTEAVVNWTLRGIGFGDMPDTFHIELSSNGQLVRAFDQAMPRNTFYQYTFTGLDMNTDYQVTVQSNCQSEYAGLSPEVGRVNFRTLMPAVNLPYQENFNTLTGMPVGVYYVNASLNSAIANSFGGSGKSIRLTATQSEMAYICFRMLNTPADEMEVDFRLRRTNADHAAKYMVGYVTDPSDVETTIVPIYYDSLSEGNAWQNCRMNTALAGDKTSPVMVCIVLESGFDQTIYIDNLDVHAIPSCVRPEALTVEDVTANTVTLSWNTTNAAQVSITATNTADHTTLTQTATASPYVFTGLNQKTTYQFVAKGVCSRSDESDETDPVTAHTGCSIAAEPTFNETFNTTSTNSTPECWTMDWLAKAGSEAATPFCSNSNAKRGRTGKSMSFVKQAAGAIGYLATPCLPLNGAAGSYDVSLWVKRDAAAAYAGEEIDLWVNSVNNDTVGGTLLGRIHRHFGYAPTEIAAGWYQYQYNIPATGNQYIIVVGKAEDGSAICFDDMQVVPAPACHRPVGVAPRSMTATTALIGWTPTGNERQWVVNYSLLQGQSVVKDSTVVTSQPQLLMTGLTPTTAYNFSCSVRGFCAVGDTSDAVQMSTRIVTEANPITTLPYYCGFEDSESNGEAYPLPLGWRRFNDAQGANNEMPYNYSRNDLALNGSKSLYNMQSSEAEYGTNPTVVLPPVDTQLNPLNTLRLSLNARVQNSPDGSTVCPGIIMVGVMTDPMDLSTFTVVDTVEVNLGSYVKFNVSLAGYQGQGRYIALSYPQPKNNGNGAWYRNGVYVDDLRIEPDYTCGDLYIGVTFSNITSTSATVTMSDESAGNNWSIAYGTEGTPIANMTVQDVTTPSVNLTGLETGTTYDVYVRRHCADGSYGAWYNLQQFSTTTVAATVPYVCGFEDQHENNQWRFVSAQGPSQYVIGQAADAVYEGQNALYVSNDNGVTNVYGPNYESSTSFAYRTIHFEPGIYYVEFRWKCQGEPGYDKGTAVLANTSEQMAPNLIPAGIVQFVPEMSGHSGWTRYAATVDMTNRAGDYNLLFSWVNDDYTNTNPPVAVDDIRITAQTCLAPNASVVSALTATTATISVQNAGIVGYEFVVDTLAFETDAVPQAGVHRSVETVNTVNLTGLAANTDYYYSIRSICSAGDTSIWMPVQLFHTGCAAKAVPYNEDFEDTRSVGCWSTLSSAQSQGYAVRSTTAKYDGRASMRVDSTAVVSPELTVAALNRYMLNGFVYSTEPGSVFTVGLISDPSDISTYETFGTITVQEKETWTEFTVYFSDLDDDDYADFRSAHNIVLMASEARLYFDNLTVDVAPSCQRPTEVTISNIAHDSFTLDFADHSTATQWAVRLNGGQPQIITAHPATINGLRANTEYRVEVASICSASDTSFYSYGGRFTTECAPMDLPWICGFEAEEGYMPAGAPLVEEIESNCWVQLHANTQRSQFRFPFYMYYNYSGYYHSGKQGLVMAADGGVANLMLTMPEFNANVQNLNISFWYMFSYGQPTDPDVEFGYLTDPLDESTFTAVATLQHMNSWTQQNISTSTYQGIPANARFAFRYNAINATSTSYNGYMCMLDDIVVSEVRSCQAPDAAAVTDITASTARVDITDTCTAHAAWQYVVVEKGEPASTGTVQSVATDTFTITGLTDNTAYELYVRAVCGAGDESAWTKASFTTRCVPFNVTTATPYEEGFEHLNAGELLAGCYEVEDNDASVTYAMGVFSSYAAHSGDVCLEMSKAQSYSYGGNPDTRKTAFTQLHLTAGRTYEFKAYVRTQRNKSIAGLYIGTHADVASMTPVATKTLANCQGPQIGIDYTTYQYLYDYSECWEELLGYYTPVTTGDYFFALDANIITTDPYNTRLHVAFDDVTVTELQGCLPATVSLDTIYGTSVVASINGYTEGETYEYTVIDKATGAVKVAATQVTAGTFTVTGLDTETDYTLTLHHVCGTETSINTTADFTTACGVILVTEDDPYTDSFEAFESDLQLAGCYERWGESVTPNSAYVIKSYDDSEGWITYHRTGTKYIRMACNPQETPNGLKVYRRFHFAAGRTYTITYYAYSGTGTSNAGISVGTSKQSMTSIVSLPMPVTSMDWGFDPTNAYREVSAQYTAPADGDYYVSIDANFDATQAQFFLYIDDYSVEMEELCPRPTEPATINYVTMTTMDVTVPMGRMADAEVGYVAHGASADGITAPVATTTGNVILTGMTAETSYDVYYRYLCGPDMPSRWSPVATDQTTESDCFAPQRLHIVGVIDDHHAEFAWGPAPDATGYEYELSQQGAIVSQGTLTTTGIVFDSLTMNSNYSFRVRTACTGETTDWETIAFATTCAALPVPFFSGFEDADINARWEFRDLAMGPNTLILGTDLQAVKSGEHAAYVSDDYFTYNYVDGASAATAEIALSIPKGTYTISYDWKMRGSQGKDYGRVFLMPFSQRVQASDVMASTFYYQLPYGAIQADEKYGLYEQTAWKHNSYTVTVPQSGVYYLTVVAANDDEGSWGSTVYLPAFAIDNISVTSAECSAVASVSLVSTTSTGATVQVQKRRSGDIFEYGLSENGELSGVNSWTEVADTATAVTVTLTGLSTNTAYTLFVRNSCSAISKSEAVMLDLHTPAVPATVPYVCSFEDNEDLSAWTLTAGSQDFYVFGTAAASDGIRSVYVSNDSVSNEYSATANTYAYAYVPVHFAEGDFNVQFDWRCNGWEWGHLLTAFILPATTTITPGTAIPGIGRYGQVTIPGAIRIDGNQALYGSTSWNTMFQTVYIPEEGDYNVVFAWINDRPDYEQQQTPAAIDNIVIVKNLCPKIREASIAYTGTDNSVTVSVSGIDEDVVLGWEFASDAAFSNILAQGTTQPGSAEFTVLNLEASTIYFARVWSDCGAGETSEATGVRVRTSCGARTGYPYHEGFEHFVSGNTNRTVLEDNCWFNASDNTSAFYYVSDRAGDEYTGRQALYVDHGSNTATQTFGLPMLANLGDKTISLRYRNAGTLPSYAGIEVGFMTDPDDEATFTAVDTLAKSALWTEYSRSLAGLPAGSRLGFRVAGQQYVNVDDIRINNMVDGGTISETLCYGEGYNLHGVNIAAGALAVGDTTINVTRLSDALGVADSTFTINLSVRSEFMTEQHDTICAGTAYTLHGWNITTPRTKTYFRTERAACGCDSTVALALYVIPSHENRIEYICRGDYYDFNGRQLTDAGVYQDIITTPQGCLDTINLTLAIVDTLVVYNEAICPGTTYAFAGTIYSTPGVYRVTTAGAYGCTVVKELHLSILPTDSVVNLTICQGGQAIVADTIITTAGNYLLKRPHAAGCDLTYHISVTVTAPSVADIYDDACEGRPYVGYGISVASVTADTVISFTGRTAEMCDSITNIHLAYHPTETSVETVVLTAGETYEWNGVTYNRSGDYTETFQNRFGCDSIATLHLEIPDGVDDAREEGRMRIVPNPATAGQAALVFTSAIHDIVSVEIINSFGSIVDKYVPNSTPIDLRAPQAAGVYHVRITTADGRVYVEKLIVR